ncbi:MAG: FMN-binding protein [Thiovulaceae bacterium]|nr:FMN-binding protein [Sulfurimonadaceae bacterium]
MRFIILTVILMASLQAKLRVTPFDAIYAVYGNEVQIEKKNVLLTIDKAEAVYKKAEMPTGSKIIRTFTVTKEEKPVAYAILISRVVRTKNAAVLYIISPEGIIESVEVIAFNEPPEYTPSKIYVDQFKGKTSQDTLRVGKDIPTVTGATMGARNVTDGARLALALFELLFKEK